MKNLFILLTVLFFSFLSKAQFQNILLINDNDNITQNTDTFLVAMQNSNYSNYTYFNAIDSSQMPSSTYLQDFDLVIYYASTDGAGLRIWDNGQNGNLGLKGYLTDGGRAWIIGTDLFFAGAYSAPISFSTTSFAYEYMGLESYNVQSYGDDGNLGLPQVNYSNTTSVSFPDSLTWIFSTLWWADGVSMRPDGIPLYEMGPNSYALSGEICMTHYHDFLTNVLGTYFDPALISTPEIRIDFINASLDYFWQFDLGVSNYNTENKKIKVYPSFTSHNITIESKFEQNQAFEIISIAGELIQTGYLSHGKNTISVEDLPGGMYFIIANQTAEKFIKK